ncbi:hypothetical protein [Myxococcus stipitatus]|uniref:hypothetical protein n=1 Tax=Myxococcus stipitatus TaxID=83455 RepID=UPI0030CB6FC4
MAAADSEKLEKVKREAQVLREWLVRSDASLARSRKVSLEPDAPELVRAFWEVVPFSKGYELAPQDVASGRKTVEKVLNSWRRTSRGYDLTVDDLPKPFRLVSRTPEALLLTDESAREPDPPVVMLAAPEGPVDMPLKTVPFCSSYLDYVATALVGYVLRGFHSTTLELHGEPALEMPLPTLAPRVLRADEHLWLVPLSPGTTQGVRRARFDQFASFIQFMAQHRSQVQTLLTGQAGVIVLVRGLEAGAPTLTSEMNVEAMAPGKGSVKNRFGFLADDLPVWVQPAGTSYYPDLVGIATDRAHREALLTWIRERGFPVVGEGEG